MQQLIESVKVMANDFQAASHMIMFQPFQRMWDQLNNLALMREEGVERFRVHQNALSGGVVSDTSSKQKYCSKAFPAKLPWHILDKVRE